MGCLEGSGVPVLYIGRTVHKVTGPVERRRTFILKTFHKNFKVFNISFGSRNF